MAACLAWSTTAIPATPAPPPAPPPVAVAAAATAWPPDAAQRCARETQSPPSAALQSRIAALLAERSVRRAAAWSATVVRGLCAGGLAATPQNAAIVLAMIERESGFEPHGLLPNAPDAFRKLAYRAIDDLVNARSEDFERLLGHEGGARFVASAAASLREASLLDGALLRRMFDHYHARFGWHRVATEWDLEHVVTRDVLTLADEISPGGLVLRTLLAAEPRWRQMLESRRIVRSVGAMQVAPESAVALAAAEGRTLDPARARELLYTMEGAVYFGVRQLVPLVDIYGKGTPLTATTAGWVAADWRNGTYSSRDAMLTAQIARLAGRTLPADAKLDSAPVRQLLLALGPTPGAAGGAAAPSASAAVSNHERAVARLQSLMGYRELDQDPLALGLRAAARARFGPAAFDAVVPEARYYSAKTGHYRLSDIVTDSRRRFALNCAQLGCAAPAAATRAAPSRAGHPPR